VIQLRVPAVLRRPALATGLLLLAAGATAIALAATRTTSPAQAVVLGAAGIVLVVAAVVRLAMTRTRNARIELWPDSMVIHYDALLRGPVRVPRQAVRAAMLDDGSSASTTTMRGDDQRFAVLSDFAWHAPSAPQSSAGWLYTRSGGSVLPLLGHPSSPPDIALILDEPVALPVRDVRRHRGHSTRFPRLGALTIGLLAASCDPAAARGALAAWGCLRDLAESDFALDRPRAEALGIVPDATADEHVERPDGTHTARTRGVLAVAAAFAFALGVLTAAVASLAGAWRLFEAGRAPVLALVLAVVGVGLLLAMVPRRLGSAPDGAPVGAIQHPRLFALLRRVASNVGTSMPDEVRIVPEVNATVHETGGLRSRRVLSLGLPLLASLSERELAGVIAHELGHFQGGDTRLGRLIARIDHELTHAQAQLAGRRWSITGLVAHPVVAAFHRLFLRLTGEMMRHAEFSADALSAREVGTATASETLTRIGGLAAAYDAFWHSEFEPAVRHGVRPPLAMGFHRFCVQPATRAFIAETGVRLLREEARGPADSHPLLRDRLAALRDLDLPGTDRTDGPALALLGDTDPIEVALLRSIVPPDAVHAIRESSWDDVVTHVHLTDWRAHFVAVSDRLAGLVVPDLPLLAADPHGLAERLGARDARALRADDARRGAAWMLGALLTVALADHGFSVTAEPGGPVTASRGRARVRPFDAVEAMVDGTIGHDEWVRRCREEGVDAVPLAPRPFPFSVSDYPSAVDEDPTG